MYLILLLLLDPACFGLNSLILALDLLPKGFPSVKSVNLLRLPLKMIYFMIRTQSLHDRNKTIRNKTIRFSKACDYSSDTTFVTEFLHSLFLALLL